MCSWKWLAAVRATPGFTEETVPKQFRAITLWVRSFSFHLHLGKLIGICPSQCLQARQDKDSNFWPLWQGFMKVLHSVLVSPMICLLLVTFLERNDLGIEVHWKAMWFIQTHGWEVVCLLQMHRKITSPKEARCPNPEVNWQHFMSPGTFPVLQMAQPAFSSPQAILALSLCRFACPSLLQTDSGAQACSYLHENQLGIKLMRSRALWRALLLPG